MMNNFIPPVFEDAPKEEEIVETYEKFIKSNGDKKFKVGVVLQENLKQRYHKYDKFTKLSDNNILCFAKVDDSLAIEEAMKKILVARGRCLNHSKENGTGGWSADRKKQTCVYLVELRENMMICPCNWCGAVLPQDRIVKHMKKHKGVQDFKKLSRKAIGTGYKKDVMTVTEPQSYKHRSLGSSACEHCGLEVDPQSITYHRTICKENKLSSYPCPLCPFKASGRQALKEHVAWHQAKEARINRNFPFKCRFCDETFKSIGIRTGHQLRCSNNDNKAALFPCPNCKLSFTTKSVLTTHLKGSCKNAPENNKETERFKCPNCTKTYKHKRSVNKHLKSCKGEKKNEQ